MFILIWGLPGAGKSTIGKKLSEQINLPFCELDDFYPESFKAKMRSGELISDNERDELFSNLSAILSKLVATSDYVVSGYIAKKRHRDLFRKIGPMKLFELVVSENTLINRLQQRKDHFFKAETLQKVLKSYEPLGDESIKIDGEKDFDDVCSQIRSKL